MGSRRWDLPHPPKHAHPTQEAKVNECPGTLLCTEYMINIECFRHRDLNATENADNKRLADARARIEHKNAWVVYSHEMFHGRPFIGSFDDLHMYVTISIHTSAAMIESEPSRGEHMGRFNHSHVGR